MPTVTDEQVKYLVGVLTYAAPYAANVEGRRMFSIGQPGPHEPTIRQTYDHFNSLPDDHPLKKELLAQHSAQDIADGYSILEKGYADLDEGYQHAGHFLHSLIS